MEPWRWAYLHQIRCGTNHLLKWFWTVKEIESLHCVRADLTLFSQVCFLPQEIQPVWKSVEDLFSFLAQSHLEAVRESTGEGVWSSDHCREAGGVRSHSAGPQTDYSPFSPIWTGRGRFCTLFPNEARRKLRLCCGTSQMESIICEDWSPWDLEYTHLLPFAALSETVSETTPAFPALLLAVAASFSNRFRANRADLIIDYQQAALVSCFLGRARMFQRCTGSFS